MSQQDSSPSEPPDAADESSESPGEVRGGEDQSQPRRPGNQLEPFRLIGLGSELAGFTLVLTGAGYAVDAALGNDTRYATALGTLIGFTFGMIRFIRAVKKINED